MTPGPDAVDAEGVQERSCADGKDQEDFRSNQLMGYIWLYGSYTF